VRTEGAHNVNLYGQDAIYPDVIRIIPAGDSMYDGSTEYYFQCGASALSAIRSVLNAAGTPPSRIKSVLDYASGYGRVLRWLKAGFPAADILAMDTDVKALAAVSEILDVDTKIADVHLLERIERKFDLIWCGSLITHLPIEFSRRALGYFSEHLASGGVCVFTVHGPYVAERIRRREKLYGLSQDGINKLLSGYDAEGYGFGPYPDSENYGISVTTEQHILEILEAAGMKPVFFESRGWVGHQDVAGAVG